MLEDLDFAAALGGSAADTGLKKKKTAKKPGPTLSEFQQSTCFYLLFWVSHIVLI